MIKDFIGDTDNDEGTIEPKIKYIPQKGDINRYISLDGDVMFEIVGEPEITKFIPHEVVGLSFERINAEYVKKEDCLCSQHIEEKAGLRRRIAELEANRRIRDEKLIAMLKKRLPLGCPFILSGEACKGVVKEVFAEVDK